MKDKKEKQREEEKEQHERDPKDEDRIYQRYIIEKSDLSTREISNDTKHTTLISQISTAAIGYLIITNPTPTLLTTIALISLGIAIIVSIIATRTANKDIKKKREWYEKVYTHGNTEDPAPIKKWEKFTKVLNWVSTTLFIVGITTAITVAYLQPHTTTETTTQKGITMKEKNSHDTRPAKVKSHTPRPTERGGTTGGNVVKPSEIPKTPKPNPPDKSKHHRKHTNTT